MSIKIRRYGQPVLRKKAQAVAAVTPELAKLAEQMIRAMRESEGCGLAAPQIGKDVQLVVISHQQACPEPLVMFNPEIRARSEELTTMLEGCLSVPGVEVEVMRPRAVRLAYLDEDGRHAEADYADLMARIIQHECDHLRGKLIIDYMPLEERLKLEAGWKKRKI